MVNSDLPPPIKINGERVKWRRLLRGSQSYWAEVFDCTVFYNKSHKYKVSTAFSDEINVHFDEENRNIIVTKILPE